MFKEFFVFTESGICLYSWKSLNITESTDPALIGGLLFAVSEFAKQAFRGRLQRLDLDNSKLIMTAREFVKPSDDTTVQNFTKTLIFGALVDSRDNNRLIQEIFILIGNEIISNYDFSDFRTLDRIKIDPVLTELLHKKTFSRNFTIPGLIVSAIGLLLGSLSISINWQYFVPTPLVGIFDIVPVLIFSFGIIFGGAMLIGERNKAIKNIMLINGLFSIFLYYFFQYITRTMIYFSSMGSFYTYVIFVLLISFTSALFGSLLTERLYLFPE